MLDNVPQNPDRLPFNTENDLNSQPATQRPSGQTVSVPVLTPPTPLATSSTTNQAPCWTDSSHSEPSKDTPRDVFLASLRENPGLESLSREELEDLVASAIRQPGFVKLVGVM